MKKISVQKDLTLVLALPLEVKEKIADIVETLDSIYGADRDSDSDGGYIAVLENVDDLSTLGEELDIDLETDAMPEYVETIPTSTGEVFTNALILCNNEYGITIIMPLEITPDNLKEYIID